MDCTCDYDPPEFSKEKIAVAKKEHTCCECGHKIQPVEKYEYFFGKWDGVLYTYKTCERCVSLRELVAQHNGGCWIYTMLFDEYYEVLQDIHGLENDDDWWEHAHKVKHKHNNWRE